MKEAENGGEGAVIYIDNCALWSDAQIKSFGLNGYPPLQRLEAK